MRVSEKTCSTQNRPGFGWKRIKNTYVGNNEDRRVLREILRDVPMLKDYCRYFEATRKSIFIMAEINPGEITFLNTEKVRDLMELPLGGDDRQKLYNYFDASTKLMVLEIGMEGLPEGQYREIAYDRYYGRLSYAEIMEKHSVTHKTVQRALRKVCDYLMEYGRWYLNLADKVNGTD